MLDKPWRSRFSMRLANRISYARPEVERPRVRLFPYSVVDLQAAPPPPRPKLVSAPVMRKIVRPVSVADKSTGWTFKKR